MLKAMILASVFAGDFTEEATRQLKTTCVWNRTASTVHFTLGRGSRLTPLQRRIRPGSFYSYAWTQGTTHPPLTFKPAGQDTAFPLAVATAPNQACRGLTGALHHRVTNQNGEFVVTGPFTQP